MKVLLLGNGGREHALLRKLHQDAPHATFFITRGNPGTEAIAQSLPLDATDIAALAAWAANQRVDLVVCGPEAPLAAGAAEQFERHEIPFFGPSAGAARIESSKAYAKQLMKRAKVPTAAFGAFTTFDAAAAFIRDHGAPIVVKASGLAAGKGAVVCDDVEEALDHARAMLAGEAFGAAGSEIVIEEFMHGEELSVFALCDGENALLMLPAQDHKRIGEGDTGANTGGMGAYAPVSLSSNALLQRVHDEIIRPTLAALAKDGHPFRGLLYAGLMLTSDGPKVVEFNARFGDPETEVVIPLLRSSLLEPMLAIARGESIRGMTLDWHPGAALTTVLASAGYPGTYAKGMRIHIPHELAAAHDILVFHAGTALQEGHLVTAGGRVFAVTAVASDLATAAERSRWAASLIEFNGRQYRGDIGWRELARQQDAAI
jgi:phosphoribosylamine--glycine ligase